MTDAVARARALAEDLLFPSAAAVDAAGAVPRSSLDALAGAGLYGLTGPAEAGGLAADRATVAAVVEELAAGDLSTTFIWLQHPGVVAALADGPAPLRTAFLADLCAGRCRGGVALQEDGGLVNQPVAGKAHLTYGAVVATKAVCQRGAVPATTRSASSR